MRLLLLTVPLLILPLARAATGGPDDGDVVYTDSAEADGPSHVWLDASGGDAYALDDDGLATIDLPFAFELYGTSWTEATISNNGVLFFSGASPLTGLCPGGFQTWTGIAAYWDDLGASTVYTETFGTYPWRTFVVSWEEATHATAGGDGRFQIWLLEGRNEAVVVLDDVTWGNAAYDDGATANIGTNGTTDGLAYSCNTTITPGTTIWFGDSTARPARASIETDELELPWTGQTDFDYAGRALVAGDVNGDGTDDLLVGTQDRGAGEVGLVYRPSTPDDLGNAHGVFSGYASDDDFGAALLATDFDGDGAAEIVVGAPSNDDAGNRAGATYLWQGGSWGGDLGTGTADAVWTGPGSGAVAAGSALAAGDVDGDGYADLVVSAPTSDAASTDAGAIYVVYGSGLPSGSASLSSSASFLGSSANDQLGGRLAVGDLDDDGDGEIVASALFADDGATNAGVVYVLPGGRHTGAADVDTSSACQFSTFGASGRLGSALLLADLDGTGLLDLVAGGSTEDAAHSDAGKAYVVYDPELTCPAAANLSDATIEGVATSANLGSALAAGDLDGDGVDDLVVGASNMGLSASGGGAVYVFTSAPTGTVDADDADHALGGSGSAAALGTALAVAANAGDVPTLVATAPYDSVAYSSEGAVYDWTLRPDFLDADGDGFVAIAAGGNDCDDASASASPDGTETTGDSLDGDCDGWVDGVVRVRTDAGEFAWDLDAIGGGETDTYDFESYADGTAIATYGDLAFSGTLEAADTVYGTAPEGEMGASLAPASTNALGITFADPIDALALRLLDADDTFTLTATGASGTVVSAYTFTVAGDDRTGGVYRGFTFVDEVTAVTITGATSDGFGVDDLEVAWATASDRDGDGYADADGDCDDTDADVSPAETEVLANGIDDDCDGIVDAGNADAYTDAAAWGADADLDATTVIDFEDVSVAEAIDDQYLDLGVLFDGALSGSPNIDGTPPHDTIGARLLSGSSTTITFDEDQPAVGLYLLDGDVTFTVYAYDDGVLLYTTTFAPSTGDAFYGLVFDLTIDELVISGVDAWGIDDVTFSELGLDDADGDGQTERDGDCDDTDATAYTGATETYYDGVDGDCAGGDDYDADQDGSDWPEDCDDTDGTVNPSAIETFYDGIDADCDGDSDYDADGDGHDDISWGGDDCDDGDGTVNPDATETWYDGVDQDCAGDDDDDADGDGFPIDGSFGGMDCDDTDATVSPGADEVYYDGVDQDCSGEEESDYDADGDGFDAVAWGGEDCEDGEPTAYPGASGEECYDGIDTDCGGEDDYDCDADGYASDEHGGADCDDSDPTFNPDATDVLGDGIDLNCDGGPEYDYDGDGYDGVAAGGLDCDDTDATVSPAAVDTCYDGIDSDCDAWDDDDCDQDGYADEGHGGDDCDDTVGGVNPGADDFPYDGVDSDCDGADEYDQDGDGHATSWYGGDDCDDTDASVYPGASDACYDGVDSDCGGEDDDDCDGDGYAADGAGGDDCDDGDASVNPGTTEVEADGVDQDCDGEDATTCSDCDGDGFEDGVDCDDTDASVYPGASDEWYDGIDGDCDGGSDYDADGDGAEAIAWGGGDCDDADDSVTPANTTDACGGGDEDCDGETDEDCSFGDTGGPDDTGDSGDTDTDTDTDTATETRDTAEDWRPDAEDLTDPTYVTQDSGCGCDTSAPGEGAALGLALAGLALTRRRR